MMDDEASAAGDAMIDEDNKVTISCTMTSASSSHDGTPSGTSYYNDIEIQFGIDAYAACSSISTDVAASHNGFAAVLKARFSDFCVNEVDMDGNVAELSLVATNTAADTTSTSSKINNGCESDNNNTNSNSAKKIKEDAPQDKPQILSRTDNNNNSASVTPVVVTAAADDDVDDNKPASIRKQLKDAHTQLAKIVGEEDAIKAIEILLYWSLFEENSSKPEEDEPQPKFHAFPVLKDKDARTQLHFMIQGPLLSPYALADTLDSKVRLWHLRFEKEMPNYGKFVRTNTHNRGGAVHSNKRKHDDKSSAWPSDKPNYLKFVMYKENMDTSTASKELGRLARLPFNNRHENSIGYAGMKDKRGVTSQFCTLYQKTPADLAAAYACATTTGGGGNTTSGSINVLRVSNFTYTDKSISLGSLSGNRFHVVLRNVNVNNKAIAANDDATMMARMEEAEKVLDVAATSLKTVGCVNYFGMQRFGKYLDNHEVGIQLLKGNFEQAVNIIMREKKNEEQYQQQQVSEARRCWETRFTAANNNNKKKEDVERIVANSIRRSFGRFMTSENKLMEHLSKRPCDYKGAMLRAMPRNMSLMFLHAVQSYIWNKAASYRIVEGGSTSVIVGDLVLTENNSLADGGSGTSGLLGKRVQIVTEQDVVTNKYSITDVVLPLVGTKIVYPSNTVGSYVIDKLLKVECSLSLKDLTAQREKELILGGDYRKLICKPSDVQWNIIRYDDPIQPLIQTDLMKVKGEELKTTAMALASDGKKTLLGMVISFTLPPSSYATIALRELMKRPTISEYQKQLKLEGLCEGGLLSTANTNSSATTETAEVKQKRLSSSIVSIGTSTPRHSVTAPTSVMAGKTFSD